MSKNYSKKLHDCKNGYNRYLISWKNKRAHSFLLMTEQMPNHLHFLLELLEDEGYEKVDKIPLR